ncbi:PDZ domain-containing protein [Microbacterium suaedae]|uniref:YlbL family protein n=1 Tax=Microbacterium suaedae TaxID=2067813 RepID=UPI000DA230F7|nr:S16 family serine protease [Microbacterium suaedae]
MTLFDDATARPSDDPPHESRGWPRRTVFGVGALGVALVALLVMSLLPTSYVLEQPGPVYNTIGDVVLDDGEEVPLIEVDGVDTYDTSGALFLTTVQVVGNREHPLSWSELALAWLDPSRAIVPLDALFPEGVTTEEREQQNAALMTDSQGQAAAAALVQLGYDVPTDIRVVSLTDDSPSAGVVEEGDRILAAEGETLDDVNGLREIVNAAEGSAVELTLERDGEEHTVRVTPEFAETEDEGSWLLGIGLSTSFELPIDVSIQLDDVGGPSAGTMFALGIIDVLTPGELTGDEQIAGTGTITADGQVGAIGGIRQKMHGARDAGAEYFLAPAGNCGEVVGNVPDGLRVVEIDTLSSAVEAVEAIGSGDDAELPSCSAS